MTQVLVTGANGFIGRHLVPRLVESGRDVHAAGRSPCPDIGVTSHVIDLLSPTDVDELLREVRPELLVHLAWYTVPGRFWSALENLQWIGASVHLTEAFAVNGGRRMISAGTCAEYDLDFGFCREGSTPTRPVTIYGASKHAVHTALSIAAEELGIELSWGRVFYTYGPGEPEEKLVSSVIKALLSGDVADCSSGDQFRDYLHVSDVASALVRLLDSAVYGPVNVGSGIPLRVADLVNMIQRMMGVQGRVRFGARPTRVDEPRVVLADVQRLEVDLGWRPAVTLEEGIDGMVAWWRQRLAGRSSSRAGDP